MTPLPIRPSRVLMTADTIGGVWHFALDLARRLGRHGVSVDMATMGGVLGDEERAAAAALSNITLHESGFRLEWMDDPWEDVERAGSWLLEIEAETSPDVVHLNGFAHGSLPWRAPVLVTGHSCVFSWFEAVRGGAPPPSWQRYGREVARGLRSAGLVTAPTGAMLEALIRHHGAFMAGPPIYNGRREADFPPAEKEPFILSAGRLWDEAKNVAALEAVADEIQWPVLLAGASRHPEGGSVSFTRARLLGLLPVTKLARWMGRASIYALPARYEPFGLTPLEAALAGCALILGDIPTLREVWADAALFVRPDDRAGLSTALNALIEDDGLRIRLANRARLRARTYTTEQTAQGYLDLYDRLLRQRRSSAGWKTGRVLAAGSR